MIVYLRFFLISLLLLVAAIAGFTYLINPYAVFSAGPLADVMSRKTAAADKGRSIKSYQALVQQPEVLLVGNSRVEIGLPAQHPIYQGKVFNLGLPGAGVLMQYDYAWHVVKSTVKVKKIFLAVDFVDFLTSESAAKPLVGNWQGRLNYQLSQAHTPVTNRWVQGKEQLSFLLSQSAFIDTFLTLIQQKSDVNALSEHGFNDGRLYHHIVRTEGFAVLYQQKQQELTDRLANTALKVQADSTGFQALELFLQLLAEQDVEVTLFVNPYHYPYLDVIQQSGLQGEFERWKDFISAVAQKRQLSLYDFSIASELVMAPLQDSSRDIGDNKYFWEPAHYRQAMGVLMLDAMQAGNCQVQAEGRMVEICKKLAAAPLQ